jgi:tetratricopeptide (TPR) repeat protein
MLMGTELSKQRDLESADNLFKAGKFSEAESLYTKILSEDPSNPTATTRLGHTALLANRLGEAQKWLTEAVKLKPDDPDPKSLLAEVFYRRDEFQQATPLLHTIGREAKARKLESFKDASPYQLEGKAEITNLRFVITDPLPVIQVRVNNSELVNFLIDTGATEAVIDTEFAREIGATQFGSVMGTFAGGKQAGFQCGRVDSLTLGEITIKNVPVDIMDVRRFRLGGIQPDSIIGTVLLYHFLATLNYVEGQLTLRRRTEENLKHVEREAKEQNAKIIPFWMAGDHYMVAWGTINNSQPMLFFVDTGLAGGGFTCPESTLRQAGIELQEDRARGGLGGGGVVRSIPFIVDTLILDDATERNIQGVYLGDDIEYRHGFRIGGIISHTFFRHYLLTFDFTGMRFFLKRQI